MGGGARGCRAEGSNASHLRDPVGLATKLIADGLAIDPTELRRRLDEVAAAGQAGHLSAAEAEGALEDTLVVQLNRIRERPDLTEHPAFRCDPGRRSTRPTIESRLPATTRDEMLRRHADLVFKRYPDELQRAFPRRERVETHRASDYRAAGRIGLLAVVMLWAVAPLVALDPRQWTPTYAALVLFVISTAWVLIVGWMADPNALALHTFYKARLIRAYLGASNRERRRSGRNINEPVPGDDVKLKNVDGSAVGGPYHLVNTTLNLVGGRDLTTAQRSAASFVLSPEFCGSARTGYRKTSTYMGGELTLGAAVATSGAAASPNMGARTPSAALAMLLALFNVRLGLWAPTPHRLHWRTPQARLWPYYLLRESLLQTNDLSSYCYLTDGGHFDNTGLYSLVERGCRFIVLIDNGADPEPCFEDVGEAIRRCRIDFGARIELNGAGFQKSRGYPVGGGTDSHVAEVTLADGKAASVHYALGKITYAPAHLRELGLPDVLATTGGTIIWIKPVLTGDETTDVLQYGLQNPVFPQQTTADQWFDESQFESYRALGEQSVTAVFETAVQVARDRAPEAREHPFAELDPAIVEQLFADVAPERRPEGGPDWLATLLRVARGLLPKG